MPIRDEIRIIYILSSMESSKQTKCKLLISYFAEMLGCAFLALSFNVCRPSERPVTLGLTSFVMTQVLEPLGGGQFNPAVTIAMAIKMRDADDPSNRLIPVLIKTLCQIIGTMLGCAGSMLTMQLGFGKNISE